MDPRAETAPATPGVAPESEESARWRLDLLRPRLPFEVPSDAQFAGGNSNDAWLLDHSVLRVCWRADRARLTREAAVLEALPAEIPHPRLLDHGLLDGPNGALSWTLCERVPGRTIDQLDDLPPSQLRGVAVQIAGAIQALHAWRPPPHVHDLLLDVDDTRGDAWTVYARQLVPTRGDDVVAISEEVRRLPHVDGHLVDSALARHAGLRHHEPGPGEASVVVHGDPLNVLVDEAGRVTALLDLEWVRLGPADLDLLVPCFLGHWWPQLRPWAGWLREDYPELVDHPHTRERLWLYGLGFALRGVLWWPPDRCEADLDPRHHVRLVRHLASAPFDG